MAEQVSYSEYYHNLEETAKTRYREKLAMLGGITDPYLTMEQDQDSLEWQNWPEVQYPDIYNYLIATPSPYTMQEMKAYKSLEGYKQFVDGWVSNVNVLLVASRENTYLVTAQVKHSQRLSVPAVKAWIAAEKNGVVICAHCNCMAGLGEACSHVAAILFTLDANVYARKAMSCTSMPCSWLPPSFRSVPFSPISDIDFSAPDKKLKTSLGKVTASSINDSGGTSPHSVNTSSRKKPLTPSSSELDVLFKKLSKAGKPVILSLIPGYSSAYVPLYEQGILPKPLTDYCEEAYLRLLYPDLLVQCENFLAALKISPKQAKEVEERTREQSGSKVWFQQRAGRITASRMKSVVRTDITQPSQSLIKGICYPENHQFKFKATIWGCEHERMALESYITAAEIDHTKLKVSSSGLVIPTSHPHMGASPDGVVSCECCGKGVIEIKCPYSCIDKSFLEATGERQFFLELINGTYCLRKDHAYYYQIQTQMKFCGSLYGDFVVWREQELIVQRIFPDQQFMESPLDQSTMFFKYAILPELLGKYYSKLPSQNQTASEATHENEASAVNTSSQDQERNTDVWCYCQTEESGEMIQCESGECKIEWFHTTCLRITSIPRGKWLCPDCRKEVVTKRKKQT